MDNNNLDIQYKEAFNRVSNIKEKLPPDVMLKFYAYYKQSTDGDNFSFNANFDVRNAFKFNAWMQLKGMSKDEAKQEYINLANTILK